jgi:hypothetical protein
MADPGYDRLVPFVDTLHRDHVSGDGTATFHAVVPAGGHEVTLVFCDRSTDPVRHGPFDVSVNGRPVAESLTVPGGEMVELRSRHEIDRGQLSVTFRAAANADWFCSAIVVRPSHPHLAHVPQHVATSHEPFPLRLSVTAVDAVAEAVVHIGTGEKTITVPMRPEDDECFHAEVPAALLTQGGTVRYRFTAATVAGRRAELPPDDGDAEPWFTVRVVAPDRRPPRVHHEPVTAATPGQDVDVRASVVTDGPVARAVLHYRYANQYHEWRQVAMHESAGAWSAAIPGDYVVSDWDLMYYIEVVDDAGAGTLSPGGDDLMEIPYWVITPER